LLPLSHPKSLNLKYLYANLLQENGSFCLGAARLALKDIYLFLAEFVMFRYDYVTLG
jgi:hypothetical protein